MPQLNKPNKLNQQVNVNVGDTLQAIALQQLGDAALWRELADINDLNIFESLPIGGSLRIPSSEDLQAIAQERLTQLSGQLEGLTNQQQIQKLLEQGISAANLPQLDLSGLRDATSGKLPWQLISWVL